MLKEPVAQMVARRSTCRRSRCRAGAGRAGAARRPGCVGLSNGNITAHQSVERQMTYFAQTKEISPAGAHWDLQLKQLTGDAIWKGLGFFAKALLLAMNWVHFVTRLGYRQQYWGDHRAHQGRIMAADGGEHAFDETDEVLAPEMKALRKQVTCKSSPKSSGSFRTRWFQLTAVSDRFCNLLAPSSCRCP